MFRKLANNRLSQNFKSYFNIVKAEGVGFTFILIFIIVLLISNIVRVVTNAERNYSIYLSERDEVEVLKSQVELKGDLSEFYDTDDAKLLEARDSGNYGRDGVRLLKPSDSEAFRSVEVFLLEIEGKDNFEDWWDILRM